MRAADLALLEEDARRLTVRDRPAADALWTQLLRPRGAVLRDYRALLRQWAQSEPEGAPEPFAGLGDGQPAILAVAVATVAKAMLGDPVSTAQVLDRIEGRPMGRKPDDGEAAESRATMVAGIEAVVRAMNTQPGDKALDITPRSDDDAKPE
jgi:hypothetical protein